MRYSGSRRDSRKSARGHVAVAKVKHKVPNAPVLAASLKPSPWYHLHVLGEDEFASYTREYEAGYTPGA